MKKKFVGIFVCMLLVATVLPVSGNIYVVSTSMPFSSGNTLYVGGTGPNNYTKIQDAINDSSDGDTVYVYDDSSPYYERVQINTSINLIGEDRNTTVIDAYGEGFAIFIRSDEVSIHELTIQNSSDLNYAGIRIDFNFGFCTISGNIIIDNDIGIKMGFAGDNNTIKDNYFFDNDWTITGSHTHSNMILGNTIDHSPATHPANGISFMDGTGNNISGNTIKNCESGIRLRDDSDYNIVLNNEISGNEYDGIRIMKCSNNQIIGNNISYNLHRGIEIDEYSNDNYIVHNNIEHNYRNAIDEGNNTWDDGEYGNYWSDYEDKYPDAKKLRRQGIWDTPYEIPSEPRGDNNDTCPLIKQWPDSVSKTVQNNENVWLTRWFERFPILQHILDVLSRFYNFMKI